MGTIHRRIDANFNFFGWKDDWLLRGIFGGHKHYDHFMKTFYATDAMKAEGLRQARDFRFNRRAANFFVQNQSVPLTHVGVVSTGFPIWRAQNEWKISAFSPDLQASLIIDSADLPVNTFAFYEKEDVRKVHIYPEKFRIPGNDNTLALLIRADMDSYIFVDKSDLEPVMAAINDYRWPIGVDSGKTIVASNGRENRILHGILLQNYAELPLNVLMHPFTLVVSRHYNWASSGTSTP